MAYNLDHSGGYVIIKKCDAHEMQMLAIKKGKVMDYRYMNRRTVKPEDHSDENNLAADYSDIIREKMREDYQNPSDNNPSDEETTFEDVIEIPPENVIEMEEIPKKRVKKKRRR